MRAEPPPGAAARLLEHGQAHLVEHARGLPPREAEAFLAEAAAAPWTEMRAAVRSGPPRVPPELRPPVTLTLRRQQAVGGLRGRLAREGRRLLEDGRVAALLLAGGQGSRLGIDGPKGAFVLGPTPDRTLYAVLGERVARASREAKREIPLVVLTAPDTDAATRAAFESGERFGLAPHQARCVVQGTLPVLDADGRALLESPGRLLRAPDGHGGALPALLAAGVLDELLLRGVTVLVTFQVDNPLARPLDPVMLGWMLERRAQALGKAVRKAAPGERVGVYARDLEGRTRIVEYSELAGVGGAEALVLGSVAVHAFDLPWLARLARERPAALPLHAARKSVTAFDPVAGAALQRDGVKLERFLFDVLPHAPTAEVLEVDRAREFAPIKNAAGADSPDTARALVTAEVRRWYRARRQPEPADAGLYPLILDGDEGDEAEGGDG